MARTEMKITLTSRDKWFLDALVEQYIYGESRCEVMKTALLLLVNKAMDAGRLPKPPASPPVKRASHAPKHSHS